MNDSLLNSTYSNPATYQISFEGSIDDMLIKNFGGMEVSEIEADQKIISTITGILNDQSALSGILNILFDYRYTIISVYKLK